jgi:hypothetical protein
MTDAEALQHAYENQLAKLFDAFVENTLTKDTDATTNFQEGFNLLTKALATAQDLVK